MNSIVFAGGCFWGVQHYFKLVRGVTNTMVGYIGGVTKFPSYQQICTGNTGHTEACKIEYDPNETNLFIILEHLFFIIDPTLLNQQGMDMGTQYRTGIYYYDDEDGEIAKKYIDSVKKNYFDPIVVEVLPATEFWDAEDYHQDYLDVNTSGYCHIGINKMKMVDKVDKNARYKLGLL